MPRRNLSWLFLITAFALICYSKTPANRYGRTLEEAFDYVARRYYEPVDSAELLEAAMKGIVERLNKKDDTNSVYIPPAHAKQFEEEISHQFGGVGMSVGLDPKTKQLVVISPLPGTPAYDAKVLPGDRILKIDGKTTQGMSLSDSVKHMHGPAGTPVVITLQREGEPQPIEKTILRKVIQEETVHGDRRKKVGSEWRWEYFLQGHAAIGYLRVTGFADAEKSDRSGEKLTVADLKSALEELREGGMRGLVLDLRDNPGGSLVACIEACRLFMEPGDIVTTRGREGKIRHSFSAKKAGPYTDFPMAILVNQHSASASEIVAACLQDHGRAVVVGQRTYGKGTVQEVHELGEDFGTLKLTVATYWRPDGQNIHKLPGDGDGATWGVMPDKGYEVPMSDKEQAAFREWRLHREIVWPDGAKPVPAKEGEDRPFVDRPLAKAVEYLEKEGK
jgi:carboxyl-terminal processing protease